MTLAKINIKEIIVKNRVYNCYFGVLIKAKKVAYKNILIDQKNYKDWTIYFNSYDHRKSIIRLSLYYHDLMGKIEEKREGKMYLMFNNNRITSCLRLVKIMLET